MSRTKRWVPYWAQRPQSYELAWRGLGRNGPITGEDPRNRYERGYDKHKAISPIYVHKGGTHCGYRECVTGKTRKEYKRLLAKSYRRTGKRLIYEEKGHEQAGLD